MLLGSRFSIFDIAFYRFSLASLMGFLVLPDEPFSFDLSDGEIPDVSNNYLLSSLESSYSADNDSSGFDFTDVAVNRGWVLDYALLYMYMPHAIYCRILFVY